MHSSEAALLEHYDKNLNYYSFIERNIDYVSNLLNIQWPGKTILDLGCGTGWFGRWVTLAACSGPYLGVDMSPYRIGHAKKSLLVQNLVCKEYMDWYDHVERPEYVVGNVYDSVQFASDRLIDIITLWDVLEHLVRPDLLLQKASQIADVYASIPCDKEYVAHLQVWKTEDEIREALKPDTIVCVRNYFLCHWRKQC